MQRLSDQTGLSPAPRWLARRRLSTSWGGAVVVMLLLGALRSGVAAEPEAFSADSPFPIPVTVAAESAYLRAGPGDDFYPTERLLSGSAVAVWAGDPSGYCALRPVEGSFSWVRAADIDHEPALPTARPSAARSVDAREPAWEGRAARAPRTGVVIADGAVARVGSQLNDLRHVAQVRLEAGERVRVIEEVRIGSGRHAGLWARIDPPAGEFRWVRLADIESTPSLRLAALAAGAGPTERAAETNPARVSASEAMESLRAAGEAIALVVNEATAPPAPPASEPQPLGVVPQAKRMLVGWLPLGTNVFETPAPVAVAAAPLASTSDELADIDLALSLAVAGSPDTWNLPQLRERLRLAAARTSSNPDRLRADAIDTRIARFEAIGARQRALAAGPVGDPSPLRLGSMWSSLGSLGSRPIRPGVLPNGLPADGQPAWTPPDVAETTGRLATVVSRRPDAPRWALVDNNNNVLVFVTPQPGINLAPMVGQQVSVRGARGYMPEYKRPYLVASEARPRVATLPKPAAAAELTR